MKQYPYIAKMLSDDSKVALFTSPKTATALTDGFSDIKVGESDSKWHEDFYTNITHEYLSNTWGVIESKEHAEFIIELAELHGFKFVAKLKSKCKYFRINESYIGFYEGERGASHSNQKQITIPLPPKAKEWVPEVGDEVYVTKKVLDNNSMQEAAEFISETYCKLISKFTHNEVEFCVLKNDNSAYTSLILDLCLSDKTIVKLKPKSKQGLLIEELQTKLCNNNAVDNYILACDIINGDIEGLSYEP